MMGQTHKALESLQIANEMFLRLKPDVAQWYHYELGENYLYIGFVQSWTGRPDQALASFQKAVEILEPAAHSRRFAAPAANCLAQAYDGIGGLLGPGRPTARLELYQKALTFWDRLVQENPVGWNLASMARVHFSMGEVHSQMGQLDKALESYQKAAEIQERLAGGPPQIRDAMVYLERADIVRTKLRIADLLSQGGRKTEALDAYRKAQKAARELTTRMAGNPTGLNDAACSLAECIPLAKDAAERDRYANGAMQTLRKAVMAGWSRAWWTMHDPDLFPLHNRDDFRRLLGELFDRGFPANPFAP